MSVLEIRGLTTAFQTARGEIAAIEEVDLDLAEGEILALVEALFRTAQPGTCPKGRRTYVEWSDADLGRRFG